MNARRRSETSRRGAALRFPLAALAFAAGATLLVFAGCGFNTHGEGNGGSGGSGGSVPCNIDSQCDDQNPCTTDKCGPDKLCVHDALDGVNSPKQTAGDCLTVVCTKGEPVEKPDNNDILDDKKQCTIDACNQGMASHTPKPVNTVCDNMGRAGGCDKFGVCIVACTTAADCMTSNPCVTASCDASKGMCVDTNLQDGTPTPGVALKAGDCKVNICVGGVDTAEDDDSDVPVTPTDCDVDACTNGVPSNLPVALEAPCNTFMGNQKGFCDNASPSPACQQCVGDGDCPGQAQANDCQHPACVNFLCTIAFTPSGMPAAGTSNPPQVAGDCQRLVCDGNGSTMPVYDAMDPADDGKECTINTCTAPKTTMFPNAPDVTTKCGQGGALSCLGGQCSGCTLDSQCSPASCVGTVLTKSQTCNVGAGQCVGVPTQDCAPYLCSAGTDACTNKCNVDNDCSQGAPGNYCTAAGGSCLPKLPLGMACGAGNHQCQSGNCVDGVCCNSACGGVCSSCLGAKTGGANGTCAAITSGTDPDNECGDMGALSCGTTGVCGNGACAIYANGTTCVAASCSMGTLTKVRTCNGGGTCTTPMPATQGCSPYLCNGMACTTSCAVDTDCAAGNYCSGVACVAKLPTSSVCATANQCTSGFCVDGFCCGSACNSACQACSAAKKQSGANNGTCGNAKNAMPDPRNLCGMSPPCGNDGQCNAGACEKVAAGTLCRASAGACDVLENCDGVGNCPADAFQPSSMVCRASAGGCDVAENCTGNTATCPADAFQPSSTVCRASAGGCDVAENCTGNTATCPADAFLPSTTVCRPTAGGCDVAESCPGNSAACPADTFLPSTTVCRAAVPGGCDIAENCTGAAAACPADVVVAVGTQCRAAAGICDVAESCTGVSNACPADSLVPAGTVCRMAVNECDLDEACTGSAAACPVDVVEPSGTACTDDGNVCTTDTCDGTVGAPACVHPAGNAGIVCRAAASTCDAVESCDGVATMCPADGVVPQGGTSPTCSGTLACDGIGALIIDCKFANGQGPCSTDVQCASNHCNMSANKCM